MMRRTHGIWLGVGLWLATASLGGVVWASDTRLALLLANRDGLSSDPPLKHAITGDLRPLKRRLKQLNFETYALENKDARAIRKAFARILKRLQKRPKVTTFFFYYSGHSDKKALHTGRERRWFVTHKELVLFFDKLLVKRRFVVIDACFSGEVIRRFGSLQRYKHLIQKGKLTPKSGQWRVAKRDLSRYMAASGLNTSALQIISSSRHLSFESSRRKSSVFTYHLCQGLDGKADLNQDGSISFLELFLYAKPRVREETGQEPQQWMFRMGAGAYTFAPAYNSRVWIPASIKGLLIVRVKGFIWLRHQPVRRPSLLATIAGQGDVYWENKGLCRRQSVRFPKQGTVQLTARWIKIPCKKLSMQRKGALILTAKELRQRPPHWAVELMLGGQLGTYYGVLPFFGSSFGIKYLRPGSFAGWLALSAWGSAKEIGQRLYPTWMLKAEVAGGYAWSAGSLVRLFAGLAWSPMLHIQIRQTQHLSPLIQFGPVGSIDIFFGQWAISSRIGMMFLPTLEYPQNQPPSTKASLHFRVLLGWSLGFSYWFQ